jgi:hypothetical protein
MEASIALQSIKSYIKLTLRVFGMMLLASESPASDFNENFSNEDNIKNAATTANLSTKEKGVYLAWTKRHGSYYFATSGIDIQNDKEGTYAVALADVNGDGALDVVAGNYIDSMLYLNDKSGGFEKAKLIGGGVNTVYGVALGDVNGDGKVDLVLANYNQKSTLYLNTGTPPYFNQRIAFGNESEQASSVALADMDGDGDLDLVQGNSAGENKLYLNRGVADDFFSGQSQSFGSEGGRTRSVALADMDGDGDVDVVVGNSGQTNKLYLNNGKASDEKNFVQTGMPIGSEMDDTYSVALADMDGDGDVDVVAGNNGKTNKLYLNPGHTDFTVVTGTPIGSDKDSTRSVALADVDGDGDLDVVVGNYDQKNKLYLNKGGASGFASGSVIGSEQDSTESVALADMDGDGDLDLVAGNKGQTNKLYLNNGFGSAAINIGSGEYSTYSVALADVDGDGDLDVVKGNNGENMLYLNKGYGVFPTTGIGIDSPNVNTQSIALADMDGDGDPDLVVGNNGKNTLHLNTGKPPNFFAGGTDIGSDSNDTESIALADVDGDGYLDLVAGNQDERNKLYLNIGGGSVFASTGTGKDIGSAQNSTQSVALGDMDGDGDLDLVTGNQNERNKLYLNNRGDSVFASTGSDIGSDNANTQSVALADMDGDGDLDLVVGNYKEENKLYLNPGSGAAFASVTGTPIGSEDKDTFAVSLADMDGDGDVDVVVGDAQQSKLCLNDGSGVFATTSTAIGSGESSTYSVALGDMDGDGDLDLVQGNAGKTSKLYLNNASGGFATKGTSLGKNTVTALALGDLDRDGDLDMVVAYSKIIDLYMNDGLGEFVRGKGFSDKGDAFSLALGDVDRDGDLDLVVGYDRHSNRFYRNSGNVGELGFEPGHAISQPYNTRSVALADMDGDGDLDVVVGNYDQKNKLYLNKGHGHPPFGGGAPDNSGIDIGSETDPTNSVALADVDGDGDLDVVVGNSGQTNKLYLNNGGDVFFANTGKDIGSAQNSTQSVALADMDGDGDPDLVVGNYDQKNTLHLNTREPPNFFANPTYISSDSDNTKSVALADVNGDGDLDLVVANHEQQNKLYLNTDTSPVLVNSIGIGSTNYQTHSAALADMDGDGDVDLVESNAFGKDVIIYKNNSYNTNAGSIISAKVNEKTQNIVAVEFSSARRPNDRNTSIDYFVSNTGGDYWLKVPPVTTLVNFPNKGNDNVRWRAELRSLSHVRTPKLEKISLTYVTDKTPPTITSVGTAPNLAENSEIAKIVYTITAKDEFSGIASYAIGGEDKDDLIVDSKTGDVTLKEKSDYEIKHLYSFTVTATDVAGNISEETTVTFSITDVDDAPPTITSSTTASNLEENSEISKIVYTIAAIDIGGPAGIASYAIGGRDKAHLSVDSQTGNVTLKVKSDYETKPNYSFTVTATDKAGNTSDAKEVTLLITDVDDTPPVITLKGESPITLEAGNSFTDPGAKVTDAVDSERTITGTGTVDPKKVGTYTLTYNASDAAGNAATAVTRTVTVSKDKTPPVITLKGESPITLEAGNSFTDPGAKVTDAVDSERTITGTGTVDSKKVGTYTLTYNASDAAGNAATAVTRTVTVSKDKTPPVITLKGESPITLEAGNSFTDPGAKVTDAVDSERTITGTGTVDSKKVGTYTLTYNASDAAGNAATAVTRTVTVSKDKTPPVITLKGESPITLEAGNSFTDPGAKVTDAVDSERTITGTGTVDSKKVGTYTLTYNASDAAGNAATAVTRTVTVSKDKTPPVITLKGESPITLEAGNSFTDPGAKVTDAVDSERTITGTGTVDSKKVGTYTLTYNASDAAGNAATAVTRTVTVSKDKTPPVITLKGESPITLEAGNSFTDPGAKVTDAVDSERTITGTGTVDSKKVGTYTLTYNASDAAGNAATAVTRTVTVSKDKTPPVITLKGESPITLEAGNSFTDPGAKVTDAVDSERTITGTGTVDSKKVGTYTLTYNASDAAGNAATAVTRTVTVSKDKTPPVITLKGESPITLEAGNSFTDPGAKVTDAVDSERTITGTGTVDSKKVGTYTLTYNASDAAGNAATAVTRTVTVSKDKTPPVITLKGESPITLEAGNSFTDPGAKVTDAVDSERTITGTGTVDSKKVGTYTLTYNASDAAGNAATAVTRTVTVSKDKTPPVITLKGESPITLEAGNSFTDPGAKVTDAVDSERTITGTGTVDSKKVGTYTLTYNASDAAGNAATAVTRTVTVSKDKTPPVITLKGESPITLEAGNSFTDPGAKVTDAVDSERTITGTGTVDSKKVGTYTLTYNASDAAGNAATAVTRTVTVSKDKTPPVITLKGESPITLEAGNSFTDPGAKVTDAVDSERTITGTGTVDSKKVGTYTLTYNASDAAGNAATAVTRTVTVSKDKTPPVITLKGESPITLEAGNSFTDPGAKVTDAVDSERTITGTGTVDSKKVGTYTLTYNASDAAGNAATAVTRTVTVSKDKTPPVITLKGESPITLEAGNSFTDPGAKVTDAVDSERTITGTGTVDSKKVGTYTLTYNASDAAGNAATAVTRTVTVSKDTTPPVITLKGESPITLEAGNSFTDPGAKVTDAVDSERTITGTGTVDSKKVGTYTLTYNASDAAGNAATAVTRTVTVSKDTTPPVITLKGESPITLEAGNSFTDPGAKVTDAVDSERTITGTGTVDSKKVGTYTLTYNASDAAGNAATAVTRTVTVSKDKTPPVITLKGESPITLEAGNSFTDPGAKVTDAVDSERTITGTGTVEFQEGWYLYIDL